MYKSMETISSQLDRLYDPTRFDQIEQLHQRAFAWQPQERIPLGVHVANPDYAKDVSYEQWLDPEVFLPIQARYLVDTLTVGSDLIPVVPLNHFGDAVITSLFGAEQFMPEGTSASLQDVGPTPLPVFSSINEAVAFPRPGMDAGIMPQVEKFARFYRASLPQWVGLVGTMPAGPFSTAMELRGTDFMYDLVASPDKCRQLIVLCAELAVEIEKRFREAADMPLQKPYTNFGVVGAGLRLGDDSICNISKEMIHDLCSESYTKANQLFGGSGHIHFCSLIDSRFEHIYQALVEMDDVAVVSSQFGFEYYEQHLDEIRGRLAVEAFYGDAYRYVCEQYGSFADWANQFVPRYKNESGLVLYLTVPSVEEGKAVWDAWQKAHAL